MNAALGMLLPFGAKGFHGKMGVKSSGIPNISKRHDEIAHKSYYGRKDFRIIVQYILIMIISI